VQNHNLYIYIGNKSFESVEHCKFSQNFLLGSFLKFINVPVFVQVEQ